MAFLHTDDFDFVPYTRQRYSLCHSERNQLFFQCTQGRMRLYWNLSEPLFKTRLTDSFHMGTWVAGCIFKCLYIHHFFPCGEWTVTDAQWVFPLNVYVSMATHPLCVFPRTCMLWIKELYVPRWFSKKSIQSVTGTDVKLNFAQYVIVNCACTVHSVVGSGRNDLNVCVYCSGLLRI